MKKTELVKLQLIIILLIIFFSLFVCPDKVMAIEKTLIFPLPQQIQITGDIFVPDETMSIIVPQNMSKNDIFLARFLVRELSDKYGIAVKIESRTDIPKGRKIVVMGRFDNPLIKRYCKENKLEVTEKSPGAEGYEFSKYMQYTRSNETKGVRGEMKNSAHYDAGDGFIIEKNDVREMVNFANENFLEVIPEIPSLTHGYYLLTRHPELAEYPGDRWPDTYCPSNPKSYELMFDVFDEYIDVIKPKMIHIGHDEWWGAPLDVCPLCKGKDFSELFAQDINKIHGYLAGKGIRIAMWGDFLLESVRNKGPQQRTSSTGFKYQTPGGTRPEVVKESIPKDILIFNWFWKDQDKEMELQNFGFKQIYGNFTPNISDWDKRTKKFDLLGGAPSAWASTNEFNFGKDLISDFLGCANFIWSSHTINQRDLATIVYGLMPSVRFNLGGKRIPGKDGDIIEPVDISSKFNLSKESKVFNINLSSLKSGEVKSQGRIFNLAGSKNSAGECSIIVGTIGYDKNPLPAEVKGIPINEDVSSLIFLHSCALPSKNQKAYFNIPDFFDSADLLGWYEIVYEDEFRDIVPIQYGVNILELNSDREDKPGKSEGKTGSPENLNCYQADPVNCSSDTEENPITFFSYEWINKRFGKKIREVNLHGTVNYQATQTNFSMPVTKPIKSNAILLAGISKVKKRELLKVE